MPAMLRVKRGAPEVLRQLEHLADDRAVEVDGVGAGLAVHGVAAVARDPLEAVVAAAHLGDVGAGVAVDQVVAAPPEQHVGAVAAAHVVRALAPPSKVSRLDTVLPTALIASSPPRPCTRMFSTIESSGAEAGPPVRSLVPLAVTLIWSAPALPV